MIVFWQPAINVFVVVSIIALQLLRLSYFVFPFSTTMEVKLQQEEKALSPMLVTLLGMVTEVKLVQEEKASCPMLVTLLPIVTVLMELQ